MRILNRFVTRASLLVAATVLLTLAAQPASAWQTQPSKGLPERLTDAEFWKLQADISEPGGYFRIEDNYTSNEMEIGLLFGQLRSLRVSGGVYMGVGPEQNFTYIAAIRPRMAFIVDIRRQAAMQHLMFKTIFEMAKDRAEFISLLFSKPRPAGLDSTTAIVKIWEAFLTVPSDSAIYRATYAKIVERLTKTHGFVLNSDESEKIKAVFEAFYYFGPGISTRGSAAGRGGTSTFVDLTGYSNDATGEARSFLTTEDNYRFLKGLHEKNLIVPITGDFGGAKALRQVGAYVKDHDAIVSAFYVSNVEQYLFGDAKQRAFYDNVATLPMDASTVFIRPYSLRRGSGGAARSLCPIQLFLQAVNAGRVYSYNDTFACS